MTYNFCEKKFVPRERVRETFRQLREQGVQIASLNGSFDLLHAGHLEMIYQASLQGDVLVVALNTDRSIQEYKSPLRPIVTLLHRMQMIGALEMVDFVTYFDEVDPRAILQEIMPHVHVNGVEYAPRCIESEVVESYGGRVHFVDLVPGLSTSHIISKIQSLSDHHE